MMKIVASTLFLWQVRVMDVADEDNMSCSGAFTLLPSASPVAMESAMTVTAPAAGDMATAGESYTVLVRGGGTLCG